MGNLGLPRRLGRLTGRFLRLTLPAVLLTAMAFLGVYLQLRSAELRELHRSLARDHVLQSAELLSDPTWNLNERAITTLIAAVARAPRAVMRPPVAGRFPDAGRDCANRGAAERIEVAVTIEDAGGR